MRRNLDEIDGKNLPCSIPPTKAIHSTIPVILPPPSCFFQKIVCLVYSSLLNNKKHHESHPPDHETKLSPVLVLHEHLVEVRQGLLQVGADAAHGASDFIQQAVMGLGFVVDPRGDHFFGTEAAAALLRAGAAAALEQAHSPVRAQSCGSGGEEEKKEEGQGRAEGPGRDARLARAGPQSQGPASSLTGVPVPHVEGDPTWLVRRAAVVL